MSNVTQLVFVKDNAVVTDSLTVAKEFNKRHDNVLRDIQSVLGDVSPEFNRLNFEAVEYVDAKGESRPSYNLTRDGWMYVVMGFTGKKAAAMKEVFIAEFNRMEALLVEAKLQPKPITLEDWYNLAKEQRERADRAEAKIVYIQNNITDMTLDHSYKSYEVVRVYPTIQKTLRELSEANKRSDNGNHRKWTLATRTMPQMFGYWLKAVVDHDTNIKWKSKKGDANLYSKAFIDGLMAELGHEKVTA